MRARRSNRELEPAEDYFEEKRSRYARALLRGDAGGSMQVVDELIARQLSLTEIHTQVIGPSLASFDDSFCHSDVGIGQEKLATQIVVGQLDRLRTLFAPAPTRSPYRVLVSCVDGEQHMIGARMVADLCLAHGWHVDFLGPNVPTGALIEMVRRHQPQVLALSATMSEGLAPAEQLVIEMAQTAPNTRIILGGPAVADDSGVKTLGERCTIARDAVTGVELIGKLLRAARPKSVLKEYQLVLARRVRGLRTQRGWTQERLAEATQVTRACIIAVEGGKQNVSMDILVRMANALDVPAETLLSTED